MELSEALDALTVPEFRGKFTVLSSTRGVLIAAQQEEAWRAIRDHARQSMVHANEVLAHARLLARVPGEPGYCHPNDIPLALLWLAVAAGRPCLLVRLWYAIEDMVESSFHLYQTLLMTGEDDLPLYG